MSESRQNAADSASTMIDRYNPNPERVWEAEPPLKSRMKDKTHTGYCTSDAIAELIDYIYTAINGSRYIISELLESL